MRNRRWLATLLLLPLLLAACGGDDDPTETTATDDGDAVTTTTTADDDGTGTQASAEATVALAETPLGEVLVDGEGMSLYLFTRDSDGKSACEGGCLQTWPPLLADGDAVAGEGVDQAMLSTFDRGDGQMQVAYGGAPLYFYAPDAKPGDTNGHGVGGVWFLVGADGEAIEAAAGD